MEPQCESLSYFVISCIVIQNITKLYNIIQYYTTLQPVTTQRLLWLQTSTRRGHDAGLSWTRKRRKPKPKPGKTSPDLRLKDIRRDIPWRCPEQTVAGEIEVFWPGVRRLRFTGEHPSRLYCTRMAREWTTAWCLLYRILVQNANALALHSLADSVIQCRYAAVSETCYFRIVHRTEVVPKRFWSFLLLAHLYIYIYTFSYKCIYSWLLVPVHTYKYSVHAFMRSRKQMRTIHSMQKHKHTYRHPNFLIYRHWHARATCCF